MKKVECCAGTAALIRRERQKRNLKQGVVARRIGVKQSWLSRLEAGQRRICVDEFLDCADAIGFDPAKAVRKLARQRAKSRAAAA